MVAKDRPIIVLSTGRAGSTLLQKLMNTNQDTLIWGEHAGILTPLMNATKAVSRSEWIPEQVPRGEWLLQKDRPLNEERWTAWDGSFSREGFHKHMKQFIDDLFSKDVPDNVRWGFKEIRYSSLDVMDFMIKIYPQAQFIFLLRNPIDSCISFAGALAPKDSKTSNDFSSTISDIADRQIKRKFEFFKEAMEHYPQNSRVVFFEQLVEKHCEVLDGISDFLGLSTGFNEYQVACIMKKDIVSERKRTSKEQQAMLKNMALQLLQEELEWYESIDSETRLHN